MAESSPGVPLAFRGGGLYNAWCLNSRVLNYDGLRYETNRQPKVPDAIAICICSAVHGRRVKRNRSPLNTACCRNWWRKTVGWELMTYHENERPQSHLSYLPASYCENQNIPGTSRRQSTKCVVFFPTPTNKQ